MQKAVGLANGDVLTLSGDATHNSSAYLLSSYKTFTVRSDSDVKHTITGTADPFYDIWDDVNYTINLSNLNWSGSGSGQFINNMKHAHLALNADNVFFTSFSSSSSGGAIASMGNVQFSSGTFTFQNNQCAASGGAIWVLDADLTFSGDDTTATFEGNMAGTVGNDIFCEGNLSFTDRGTYSFDGGIDALSTSINQAQVTIAGRQYRPDDPTEEDTTNEYNFGNSFISTGGTLTANMDYINRLNGMFTFSDEESLITMNKGSDTATIMSGSTGNSTIDLDFDTATDVETISISSGRINVKGAMSASIELQSDATFSPGDSVRGDSVGTLDLDGNFIANSGILLFEQDATGMDKLIANSYTIGNGVQLELVFDAPLSEDTYTMYDIIVANNGFTTEQGNVSFWENLLTAPLPEGMIMSVVNGNTVRLEIGPKPVPEPTTWALLILGVTGLLYVRKRKN